MSQNPRKVVPQEAHRLQATQPRIFPELSFNCA